jgi:prophage DNA circulation protein
MAYKDRLRTAAYRSPSGATFTLQFDDVERQGGKKAAVHEFPQQNTADVQDLGNQAERFPLSIYFTGADYDLQADNFWRALSERGPGSLQHPRYGDIPVLPLSWAQSEKLVNGLGAADFKIDFIRVQTQVVFPITSVASGALVSDAVQKSIKAGIDDAAELYEITNAAEAAAVKAQTLSFVEGYEDFFGGITAISEGVQTESNRLVSKITNTIDTLIDAPAELFTSVADLAALPARIGTSIVRKVDAYRLQVVSIIDTFQAIPATYAGAIANGQALLAAFGFVAEAATVGDLTSREEAITAAETLDAITQAVQQGIEATESAVPGYVASQETLAGLTDAMANARAALINQAYNLRTERRITLATERTPLDLVAEFYGGSIDELDDFIKTNGLQGDEIILIPAGREVVYYA